jgi:hypothetical protein
LFVVTTNTSSFIETSRVTRTTEPELLLPKLENRYKVKSIYPFITILYFMAKFVEMDERIKFKDQSEER